MRLLFVHDYRVFKGDDNFYTLSMSYDILYERYIKFFGEMRICNRLIEDANIDNIKMQIADGENVSYCENIPHFLGPDVFINKEIKKVLLKETEESDAVIVRLDSFLGLQELKICRKLNKPYIIELVGCAWDSFWNHGLTGKIIAPYIFFRTKNEIRKSKYVIYVTKEFLQKRYPTKGETTNISNVLLNKHSELTINKRLDKIKETQNKKYIFQLCTVAAVNVKYKGQQFVLKTMARLKKSGKLNFIYHLVGPGDPKFLNEITQKYKLEDYVVFHGSLTHNKVIELLDDMDVYIQPSFQEGLPRAVIEAMSRGLLCIGSDVAGIPELLDENWIFKRRKNVEKQIENLLLKIDSDTMKEQARRNFNEAKKYEKDLLEQRRRSFFENFLEESKLKV